MVLGSHQFSRHANQHTHGSRTHRPGRRRLACATAPLWHRPIYRQWGIPPRPETALASVAPVGFRASMPRVIYGRETPHKYARDRAAQQQCCSTLTTDRRQVRKIKKGSQHRIPEVQRARFHNLTRIPPQIAESMDVDSSQTEKLGFPPSPCPPFFEDLRQWLQSLAGVPQLGGQFM